ncbi:MAG: hypothetical protein WDM90_13545 [Ferruginibacter sp.]
MKSKNEGGDENGLVVKTIMVDAARVIKLYASGSTRPWLQGA